VVVDGHAAIELGSFFVTKPHTPTKRVVFLGAGASKAFGYPATTEILPRIREGLESNLFHRYDNPIRLKKKLTKYLEMFLPGWNLKGVSPPPITDVLSLLDHSLLWATAPIAGCPASQLVEFRRLLEQAIYEVIVSGRKPTSLRDEFVKWLLEQNQSLGIITTNYDMAVERPVFRHFSVDFKKIYTMIDFGFSWRPPVARTIYPRPLNPALRFYKLHGSINWLRCDLCEQTYINLKEPIGIRAFDTTPEEWNSCWCGHYTLSLVLVAPSLVRDIRNPDLLHTWKNSLEWLRQSDNWTIIGYSFPAEDLAIRSMFLRAYHGRLDNRAKRPNVTVVQKRQDQKQDRALEDRYRMLFPECDFFWDGLEGYIRRSYK
jgi:NAD-dependent SIR2 family protein deacetylase